MKPPAVVRVRDAADVRAVVRWADRYDVPLVTRSGGHGYNGNSTSASAVVVDVGGARLDPLRRRDRDRRPGRAARATSTRALARRGVTVPAGSCPTVAIGGLALGGGMGLAGRAMGLTLDRVRSFDVVTADGRRRRVSGDDDLFWALRGGGGCFGIVTAIRLRTRRVDRAAFFQISYGRGAREEALAAWDAFAPRAPRELTAIFTLTSGGATAFGQYLGSESALRRLIAPLGGSPSTGSADYLTVQRRWAGSGSGRVDVRGLLDLRQERLSARGRRAFLAAADTGAGLILDAYGGAINRAAAVGHRVPAPRRPLQRPDPLLHVDLGGEGTRAPRPGADRRLRHRRLRQLRRPGPRRCATTTAPTWRGCAGSSARSIRRTASGRARGSGDGQRRADRHQLRELQDVGVAQPHAAVRDPPGDQPRRVRAVDADDAAARPVGQRRRRRARDERQRPVDRAGAAVARRAWRG